MHRIRSIRFLVLATLLLVASASVFAQTGGVKGKVRNMYGNGIANATITARQDGKEIRSTKSNNKGDFVLNGLNSGVYNIAFDARGYTTGVKHDVEVRNGRIRDLGSRLILLVDRGTQVIINGSVYYKEGHSVPGARVEIERLNADGSSRRISSGWTSESGEFTFRQPEGGAIFRVTATYKGSKASKDIEVDSAAIYRLAITLDLSRNDK